jgi:hypothetical protein
MLDVPRFLAGRAALRHETLAIDLKVFWNPNTVVACTMVAGTFRRSSRTTWPQN